MQNALQIFVTCVAFHLMIEAIKAYFKARKAEQEQAKKERQENYKRFKMQQWENIKKATADNFWQK